MNLMVLRLTDPFLLMQSRPTLAIRLYDDATGNLVGYLDTPYGIAANAYGRSRNMEPGSKLVFETTDWRDGMIYTDRNAKTATRAPAGRYKVVVAAQRKFSQGAYPADFEVKDVAVITL